MISITIISIGLLIAIGVIIAKRDEFFNNENGKECIEQPKFWAVIAGFIIITIIGLVQPYSLQRVDAGAVGVRVNLAGAERGVSNYTYATGYVIINTWTEMLYEFPTYQQHIEYRNQPIITKGGYQCNIKPSFNYSIVPEHVGDMFVHLRLSLDSLQTQWLQNAIVGSVNDIANKWTVDSIFNHRELFEHEIISESNKRVKEWFVISQLRTNIDPPKTIQDAITAKTRAVQETQAAEQQTLRAQADAQRKIAEARGDSAQSVIAAKGEAEAIRAKQLSLTPEFIEYLKITRWNGVTPTTVLDNGSSTIISVK